MIFLNVVVTVAIVVGGGGLHCLAYLIDGLPIWWIDALFCCARANTQGRGATRLHIRTRRQRALYTSAHVFTYDVLETGSSASPLSLWLLLRLDRQPVCSRDHGVDLATDA